MSTDAATHVICGTPLGDGRFEVSRVNLRDVDLVGKYDVACAESRDSCAEAILDAGGVESITLADVLITSEWLLERNPARPWCLIATPEAIRRRLKERA